MTYRFGFGRPASIEMIKSPGQHVLDTRPEVESVMADRVTEACIDCFPAHKDNCSGFVSAVGQELGVTIEGVANQMVDAMGAGDPWRRLTDGNAAAAAASAGKLVLAGLRGDQQSSPSEHGHVVVVVPGPLAHGRYPTAYWGRLHGVGSENQTINWAWNEQDRDRVLYAERDL